MSEFNDARRQIKAIERRADFVGISRLALALLPLFAALILVGGLVWGFGSMVGIGPLFGWIWASFTAASLWWHKLLKMCIRDRYGRMSYVKGRGLCVFCINELPVFKDKSESLYRRFIVIPFVKRFVGEDENPAIKNDYLKRPEVLEYVAYKALMMDPFEKFVEPDVCKKLLGQMRVDGDPVLQFAEEFLPQCKWDLLPWKFLYALYRAWMLKEVPSGRAVSKTVFEDRIKAYVNDNLSCGWTVTTTAAVSYTHLDVSAYRASTATRRGLRRRSPGAPRRQH